MRHLLSRPIPLILLVVAAMMLAACSGDSGSKKAKPKRNAAPTSSTAPAAGSTPLTLSADPAACLRGSFRFTRMDYDGPVRTAFGPTTIKGGIAGRRIELKRDNTFHFTDDGRDRV